MMKIVIKTVSPEFVSNKEKGRISIRVFQQNKACQIFGKKNKHFLAADTHMYVCVSGVKKCSGFFSENLACFVFLKRDLPFCLITNELGQEFFFRYNFSVWKIKRSMVRFSYIFQVLDLFQKQPSWKVQNQKENPQYMTPH